MAPSPSTKSKQAMVKCQSAQATRLSGGGQSHEPFYQRIVYIVPPAAASATILSNRLNMQFILSSQFHIRLETWQLFSISIPVIIFRWVITWTKTEKCYQVQGLNVTFISSYYHNRYNLRIFSALKPGIMKMVRAKLAVLSNEDIILENDSEEKEIE